MRAVTVPNRYELPYCAGFRYNGFVDPSGGARDSMTLAVAHKEPKSGKIVLDCVREVKPPFNPTEVCRDFGRVLRSYRITSVQGDRYSGEWVRTILREAGGVAYHAAERTKSEIYGELLPLINAGQVELLDHKRLVAQLTSLERKTSRQGRDSIAEPPGLNSHDDVVNAAAGAMVYAKTKRLIATNFDPGWDDE